MDAMEKLRKVVARYGTATAAARALDVSHECVAGALAGRIPLGPKLVIALGCSGESPAATRWRARKERVYNAVALSDRPIGNSSIEVAARVNKDAIREILQELEQEGRVEKFGRNWRTKA